jgi:polyhydroxybutyrate depolymerase
MLVAISTAPKMRSVNARVARRNESLFSPSFAKVRRAALPTSLLLAAIGCSASEEPPPEGMAGMAGVAGTPSPGGSGGSGNVAGMSGSGPGAGAGGQPGGSGGMPGGGAGGSSGGQSGGAAGSSSALGGAGGSGGSAGGAGGSAAGSAAGGGGGMSSVDPPKPSAGCNKDPGAVGSAGSPLTVSGHKYYVKLPTAYDSKKPYPVLFVFHPTNNPIDWAEKSAGFEQNGAKDAAIRVYPAAANNSSGWVASDVSFFAPLFEKVTGDYCVDQARAFATGESSGGDFSSILGCEHADKLRAVAPCATKNVPQYPLNAETRKCTGQVAAIVIHGKNDNVVGPENGPKTRDFYAALNNCGTMTTPVMGYTDSQSNCVAFQGCDAKYPVYWCQHSDPNYSNTNHGWPKFANNMIWQTVSKY